jgi:predicted phosphodiesterase
MADPLKKILEPIKDLQVIRGVELPIGLEFLQLVVTGPPGAGKSYYIEQIKGWPNEGYLDLSQKGWWKDQSLIYRPREVHLGLPFVGFKESLTVFDKEWLKSSTPLELELSRIVLPPEKKYSFQTNWRTRYIFEFLIPGPSTIFDQRMARQKDGYFPVDEKLTIEMVRQQVAVYREVALYLHRAGLNVYLRKGLDKPPMFFAEPGIASVPRWTLDKIPQMPPLNSLAGWRYLFRRRYPIQWITVTNIPQKIEQVGRIAHNGRSFILSLGSKQLRFHPEIALGVKKKVAHKNWIINTDISCSTKKIRGFMRIKVGETIVLGQSNPEFLELFDFDETVGQRHISITNRRGDLILTPLTQQFETKVALLDDLDLRERLERGRHKALLKIRRIYGQAIAPLPSKMALDSIRAVNTLLAKESFRSKNDKGDAGGLIEIGSKTSPVIVGDLHAQVDNLLKILSENCLLDCLRLKTATLIILGDAVHSENANELDKFETSMLMMDLIFRLKLTFPDNFFYIRGNHDSFSPEINKNGYLQGELFENFLREVRGEEYVNEMKIFYDRLAYVVSSEDFLCCHAGPPRGEMKRNELINITPDSRLAKELTKNRIQRPNYLGGYNKGDVKRFRKSLKLPAKTTLFVGHTPMDPFGSYWLNAGTIKNHHVIYSAHEDGPSIFIRANDSFMPISFPAEPLTEFINDLK